MVKLLFFFIIEMLRKRSRNDDSSDDDSMPNLASLNFNPRERESMRVIKQTAVSLLSSCDWDSMIIHLVSSFRSLGRDFANSLYATDFVRNISQIHAYLKNIVNAPEFEDVLQTIPELARCVTSSIGAIEACRRNREIYGVPDEVWKISNEEGMSPRKVLNALSLLLNDVARDVYRWPTWFKCFERQLAGGREGGMMHPHSSSFLQRMHVEYSRKNFGNYGRKQR